jgi:hypothetical protein
MIAPNLTDEKYKKMPVFAKTIYWSLVCIFLTTFGYFFLARLNLF